MLSNFLLEEMKSVENLLENNFKCNYLSLEIELVFSIFISLLLIESSMRYFWTWITVMISFFRANNSRQRRDNDIWSCYLNYLSFGQCRLDGFVRSWRDVITHRSMWQLDEMFWTCDLHQCTYGYFSSIRVQSSFWICLVFYVFYLFIYLKWR